MPDGWPSAAKPPERLSVEAVGLGCGGAMSALQESAVEGAGYWESHAKEGPGAGETTAGI